MRRRSSNALLIAVALAVASGTVAARSSDRNQPMDIQADSTTYNANNDGTPTVLTGNVVITQGTLKINSVRADVSRGSGDITRTVLTGAPVRMSQQMDDGTPINVVASRVDYDMKTEIVTLTGNVVVTQPRGDLRGERVIYNMRTGQVQSGGQGNGRVRMTIQPKAGG